MLTDVSRNETTSNACEHAVEFCQRGPDEIPLGGSAWQISHVPSIESEVVTSATLVVTGALLVVTRSKLKLELKRVRRVVVYKCFYLNGDFLQPKSVLFERGTR